jgi:hypothetical protein|tara:strand:- start:102 stop:236 length:135 start_codon:yes stop_codon:yes gene_type:complete
VHRIVYREQIGEGDRRGGKYTRTEREREEDGDFVFLERYFDISL